MKNKETCYEVYASGTASGWLAVTIGGWHSAGLKAIVLGTQQLLLDWTLLNYLSIIIIIIRILLDQVLLSMEHHVRVGIKAPGWGSVNLSQFVHYPLQLGYSY